MSRTSSAMNENRLITFSGVPSNFSRSFSSCEQTPTGQVLEWHCRTMMQPMATRLAVPMPNSSAPSIAAITTSRPVLMPAIGAQLHAMAQPVEHQHLMRLRQAHLPGQAGVFDRALRAGAGAADMAGDQDRVGLRLGDAGGDRADAAARNELHADGRVRVDLLEVVDELGEILDRVDVVMRRRADEHDARASSGAACAISADDLEAGKLTALAGLCALRDLDLDLTAVVEVFGGYAEPSRGDLLDRR